MALSTSRELMINMLIRYGVIFIFTYLIGGCSHATPDFCRPELPNCMNQIVGTYLGEAFGSGGIQHTLTSFYINNNGNIEGKYFINYKEHNNKEIEYCEGELFDFTPLGEYVAWTTWRDNFGKGNLRLVFRFNGKEFAGYWGNTHGNFSFPWYGRKVSDTPAISDEDIEKLIKSVSFMIESTPQWPNQFLY